MIKDRPFAGRALIIDQHTTYPIDVCRALALQGYLVDAFAELAAPVLRSRYCYRRFRSRPWYDIGPFLAELRSLVEGGRYDVIYICSEEILSLLPRVVQNSDAWRGLVLPRPDALARVFSKNTVLRRMIEAGVAVPRTRFPQDESDVLAAARELGFPVVVKGEKGGASWNVRVVHRPEQLLAAYREIVERERGYQGRPALQEFIPGPTYLAGGVFQDGRTLRLCAHRMLLMNPPRGGATVKAVTERPPALVDLTLRAFEALDWTGLAEIDLIRDTRDGQFKFLEINPRVWASIGLARRAGVDLFEPYRRLAAGLDVEADLRYREGVFFHRFSGELHLICKRPLRLFGFLRDCLDPNVYSDFAWHDLGPHAPKFFPVHASAPPARRDLSLAPVA
jgi:predicted ATP-grasp superfamily ATP-dependent carboligase